MLNKMCYNCLKRGTECDGTEDQVWTGCIYRKTDPEADRLFSIAFQIDRFSEDFDPYEYRDQVEDPAAHVQQIQSDLKDGNFEPYRTFLENSIIDAPEEKYAVRAGTLLKALDKIQFNQK